MPPYQFWLLITTAVLQLISIIYQGYLSKKGQNKADKEDIYELTKIVESVKSDNIRENAKINTDLDILKDRRGKNYTQAQQAIISYYTDFANYIYFMGNTSPYLNTPTEFDGVTNEVKRLKYKIDVSMNIMYLLVDSKAIVETSNQLRSESLKLQLYINGTLTKLKAELEYRTALTELIKEAIEPNLSIFKEKEKESFATTKALEEEFLIETIKLFQSAWPLHLKYRDAAKVYLMSE